MDKYEYTEVYQWTRFSEYYNRLVNPVYLQCFKTVKVLSSLSDVWEVQQAYTVHQAVVHPEVSPGYCNTYPWQQFLLTVLTLLANDVYVQEVVMMLNSLIQIWIVLQCHGGL